MRAAIPLRLAVGTLVLAAAQAASAISIRPDRAVGEYNSLALSPEFTSAGFVADSFGSFCSGALVSPTHALTASHCLDDDADGQLDPGVDLSDTAFGFAANVPGSVTPNVVSAAIHPQWISSGGDPAFDLAVLTLSGPVTGVAPARISDANPQGLVGTMVGYGDQGLGNNFPSSVPGANDRLAAQNVIDRVTTTVETDFDSPLGNASTLGATQPIHLEGTTGPGDSGGPLFADFGGVTRLVGVLNGGANAIGGPDSEYGDISEWAAIRNAQNLSFLAGFGITPVGLVSPGDFNGDGLVDARDYFRWRENLNGAESLLGGAGDGSGTVDQGDYALWAASYGTGAAAAAIPEPGGIALSAPLLVLAASVRRRRRAFGSTAGACRYSTRSKRIVLPDSTIVSSSAMTRPSSRTAATRSASAKPVGS